MEIDPVYLSLLQFEVTDSFYIVFLCLIIGLATYLDILKFLWLKTKQDIYRIQYQFWVNPFAAVFTIGMIAGVVLSYPFRHNPW